LFEDDDSQTYLYCSGNGLFQAGIDLNTGKLTTPIQMFLDKKHPGWPQWMMGGIEGPFVKKRDGTYFMFFSTLPRGYEVALLKSKNPFGPWELVSSEPIFGTRKKDHILTTRLLNHGNLLRSWGQSLFITRMEVSIKKAQPGLNKL
jgi:xylan 1,4-beta-xylosidase